MRLADRTPREQVRRRQAKAQRAHTRRVKGRRSPAQQRRHAAIGPAGRTQIFHRGPLPSPELRKQRQRDTFIRRGLSRLNPFKGRRAMKGGGHRG